MGRGREGEREGERDGGREGEGEGEGGRERERGIALVIISELTQCGQNKA